MKRFILVFLTLMIFSCASSSVKKNKEVKNTQVDGVDLFLNENNGQYVIYHDKRGGQNSLQCFLKFNKTDYVARKYDLNSGVEVVFQFNALKKLNGEFDVKIVNVFTGDKESVLRLLSDMLNMASQYNNYVKSGGGDNAIIKDEWKEFGYTLNHSFRSWVPFFKLYKTEMHNKPENSITLIFEGKMNDKKDYEYFNLKSLPQAVKFDPFKLEKNGNNFTFKFGVYETKIDQNWVQSGVNNEFIQSYWVKKKSLRDAHVTMEVIPSSMLGVIFSGSLEEISYKSLGISTWVIPSSVKIEKRKNFVKITYVVLDPATKYETFMYDIHMKDKSGNLNSFHFSAYKDVYDLNKKYFDSIIKNLKISQ